MIHRIHREKDDRGPVMVSYTFAPLYTCILRLSTQVSGHKGEYRGKFSYVHSSDHYHHHYHYLKASILSHITVFHHRYFHKAGVPLSVTISPSLLLSQGMGLADRYYHFAITKPGSRRQFLPPHHFLPFLAPSSIC